MTMLENRRMGDLLEINAPGHRRPVAWLITLAALVLISNESLAAESKSPRTEQVGKVSQPSSSPTQAPDKGGRKQKLQKVQTALLLLLGIAFVGLMLLGLVILWGVRVRRNAKKSLPTQMAQDELWYLKPDKKTSSADLVGDAGDESDGNDSDANNAEQS